MKQLVEYLIESQENSGLNWAKERYSKYAKKKAFNSYKMTFGQWVEYMTHAGDDLLDNGYVEDIVKHVFGGSESKFKAFIKKHKNDNIEINAYDGEDDSEDHVFVVDGIPFVIEYNLSEDDDYMGIDCLSTWYSKNVK